eukprot:CAMPEP_0198328062 /NCGR_PEP_ID=MMETSP1450-20131203/15193_1 /TAXON_ID=753684 ORGANISM="Madagascaria erythrocladiodes, Strain CCMP3234" /NCGR_SAMPLE_ID=MMETSP1450 /ASSEMBLY_ACC=CAM_ASM_001115 /LENGTH=115 /DNA_ID=CAMNT_0044032151 /DNA_START=77 /DNA_END=424 /DNA_ORIENTATION=-
MQYNSRVRLSGYPSSSSSCVGSTPPRLHPPLPTTCQGGQRPAGRGAGARRLSTRLGEWEAGTLGAVETGDVEYWSTAVQVWTLERQTDRDAESRNHSITAFTTSRVHGSGDEVTK